MTDTWNEMLSNHYANDDVGRDKFSELDKLDRYFLTGLPIDRAHLRALKELVVSLHQEWTTTQLTIASVLTKLAEEAGRDPASIDITIHSQPADRDLIKRFEEAGANRVLVRASAPDHDSSLKEIEELAAEAL